jgi:hypothetical protein
MTATTRYICMFEGNMLVGNMLLHNKAIDQGDQMS